MYTFATTLCNFTNFKLLFLAVVKDMLLRLHGQRLGREQWWRTVYAECTLRTVNKVKHKIGDADRKKLTHTNSNASLCFICRQLQLFQSLLSIQRLDSAVGNGFSHWKFIWTGGTRYFSDVDGYWGCV